MHMLLVYVTTSIVGSNIEVVSCKASFMVAIDSYCIEICDVTHRGGN
jgi:hypothetical protein